MVKQMLVFCSLYLEDDISMLLNLLRHGIGSLAIIRLLHVFFFAMHLDGH